MTLHYVFFSSQWQQWASVGTSVKNTVVFSRNTLLTLTQFDTFTPGSRRVQPQSELLVSELLRCRYREPIITYVRRDDGTRFWTVFPGRRSLCCTRLFTREVAEVVVWRMKKESWREIDPNTSTFLSSTHLARRCVKWVRRLERHFLKVGETVRRQKGVRRGGFRCRSTIRQALQLDLTSHPDT